MKKLLILTSVIITLWSLQSCTKYDDYYGDFTYTTSYFANSRMDRSVIVDEFDYIQVGAVLGGKLANEQDEWVRYEMVDSLVTNAGFEVLPTALYETENDAMNGTDNVITIPKGSMLGMMKVKLKSEFFADPKALSPTYALGFRIVDASTDSIGNNEMVVTFKYMSNAIGIYSHSGKAVSANDTLVYANAETELVTFEPAGTNSVKSDKVELGSLGLVFILNIDEDNKVTMSSADGSDIAITMSTPGFFDRDNDHSIYLNYSFDNEGVTYEAQDTLTFVKRYVDNILQWDTRYF